MYKRWGKKSLDILFAGTGLIVLFPLFILITLLLFISGQRNPFFFQSRPGLNGAPFTIIKFKSMTDEKDNSQLPENERITKIGKVLRRSSLDEIPQLWNVISGKMSLIGPRPLLTEYLPRYNTFQAQRHDVQPGITGWAQVNGRNAISWEQKLSMDVWYTRNISFALDCKILAKTILKLLQASSTQLQETDIPEKFKG